ncbi:transcriptional regulator [Janthinobacterium sp. YR213]|uniref:transcriptional regulator n=1 Tax=Janthinobacterium sp. YR213 TaxID=1881027 RepID=UPI0008881487|nr:transcriptional regulator [Janthinobacterium sp. YR213]SDG75209.1 transcriptional regulator, XRE family [Janthinobacterium sp. YR213]
MYNQIFFTNVLRVLDELGISKNELSDRAGMSVSFLSDLTNGKANPSLKIMESIAKALDVALPALLEITDLDQESLDMLAGGKAPSSLPPGYVRMAAVLTEYQAFQVRQWNDANRKHIASAKPEDG